MTRSRQAKILKISQAHLAPNMTLLRWQQILAHHGVGRSWETVSDETIEAIISEIAAIVRPERTNHE